MKLPKNYKEIIRGQLSPLKEYITDPESRRARVTRIRFDGDNVLNSNMSYNSDKYSTINTSTYIELFAPFANVLPTFLEQELNEIFGDRFLFNKPSWYHVDHSRTYHQQREILKMAKDKFLNESLDSGANLIIASTFSPTSFVYKSSSIKNMDMSYEDVIELNIEDLIKESPNLSYITDVYAKRELKEYAITRVFVKNKQNGIKDLFVVSNELSLDSLTYIAELLALLNMDNLSEKQKEYIQDMNKVVHSVLSTIVLNPIVSTQDIDLFTDKYNNILNKEKEVDPVYVQTNETLEELSELNRRKNEEIKSEFKGNIRHYQEIIVDKRDYIGKVIEKIENLKKELFYLENSEVNNEKAEALAELLTHHPDILGYKMRGNDGIHITSFTHLDYFEPEFAKEYFTPGQPKYRKIGVEHLTNFSEEDIYWVLEQIFVFRNYRIPIYSHFIIGTANNRVSFLNTGDSSDFNMVAQNYLVNKCNENYYFNPHLEHYSCSGENEDIIREALQNGNIEIAIAQALATVKNMNFLDVYVTERLIIDLTKRLSDYNGNYKLLKDLDGNSVSLKEILEKRDSEKKEKQEVDSQIKLMAV